MRKERKEKCRVSELIERSLVSTILLFFSAHLFLLSSVSRDVTVVAPGRGENGAVPIQELLTYGGNLGWEKYLTLFGPFKRLIHSATPDFGLEGSFLILPILIVGLFQIRLMQGSRRLLYVGLLLVIGFVGLFALPYEPLVTVLVNYVPLFDQMRHLAYTSSTLLVYLSTAAILVLSEIYNAKSGKNLTQNPKNKQVKPIHLRISFFRVMYFFTVFYALLSPLTFHLLNVSFPKLLGLYPNKEWLCGVSSMEEFKSTDICKYIYIDWRSNRGSFFGSESIIDVEKWKIMMASILLISILPIFERKFKEVKGNKREFSGNSLNDKWLIALLILVFGSGIVNYQYSNKIWQHGAFGFKGFTLASNFGSVYEELPASLEKRNVAVENELSEKLVNEHTMISIYENVPSCSIEKRVDLVQKEITRLQVPLRRVTEENTIDIYSTVCNTLKDEFRNQYFKLNNGLELVTPRQMFVAYNLLQAEYVISSDNGGQIYSWSASLPYDRWWKLRVNDLPVELHSDENGFLASEFPNRNRIVVIKLERDRIEIFSYFLIFLAHILTFCLFVFFSLKRVRNLDGEA